MVVICDRSMSGKTWVSDGVATGGDLLDFILQKRGIISDEAKSAFLNPTLRDQFPSPSVLKDADKAAKIIANAVRSNEKIAIFGDYDVDGITSVAILVKFFTMVGADVIWHLPDRESEGYGLNESAVSEFAAQGAKHLITVDCGISASGPARLAKNLGMSVVITDHHQPTDSPVDAADAVVNPKQAGDDSGLDYLSGVGVAFMFLVALNRELSHPVPDMKQFLDLVAVGTICDTMPLVGLNRVFVSSGLKNLGNNVGIKSLANVARIKKMDAYAVGFAIGPRLNAAGRITDASIALDLILTQNYMIADDLAEKLNAMNTKRQSIQSAILTDADSIAQKQVENGAFCLFVSGEAWHGGVMGIVAGRLKEKYNLPCCVATRSDGVTSGSGRSIEHVDLGKIIHSALDEKIIMSGGGHAAAAGFELRAENEDRFAKFLNERVAECLQSALPRPKINIDLEMDAGGASIELAEKISQMEPFGIGNPEPMICLSSGIWNYGQAVGNAGAHLSGTLKTSTGTLPVIGFNMSDSEIGKFLLNPDNFGSKIKVVGKLRENNFAGKGVQLFLEDIAV